MKHILIIVAHPKKESFSFAMADTYEKTMLVKGHTAEILDLYRDPNQQPFLHYEDANTLRQTPEMQYYQAKIAAADELVFIFPYWWGSSPAILKNFIDWNFSKGFAFTYINSRPQGLLQGKTAKIFTTTGAPSLIYTLTGANRRLKNMFKAQIIEFCGMKLEGFHSFGSVDTCAKNTNEILEKITKLYS